MPPQLKNNRINHFPTPASTPYALDRVVVVPVVVVEVHVSVVIRVEVPRVVAIARVDGSQAFSKSISTSPFKKGVSSLPQIKLFKKT